MGAVATIADVIAHLEAWAPSWSAEKWDNSGLQLGRPGREVTRGVIALDLTPAVIREAVNQKAQLIVTHHPVFFEPIKSLTDQSLIGSMALDLAENHIAHYAIHTNLDAAREGVSFALARQLGLTGIEFLQERSGDLASPDLVTGFGAVGSLDEAMVPEAFLEHVLDRLEISALRCVRGSSPVRRVAVCGGSGTSFLREALQSGADAYVTADIKYHQFFDALAASGEARLTYVDAGHYETERITEAILLRFLNANVPAVSWIRTESRTSPIESVVR